MGNDVKKIRLSNLYICGLLLFFLSLNTYNYICFLNASPDFISLITKQSNDINIICFPFTYVVLLFTNAFMYYENNSMIKTNYIPVEKTIRTTISKFPLSFILSTIIIGMFLVVNFIVSILMMGSPLIITDSKEVFIFILSLILLLVRTAWIICLMQVLSLNFSHIFSIIIVMVISFIDWGFYIVFNYYRPTHILLGEYSLADYSLSYFPEYEPNYLHYMIFWPLIFILLIVFLYLSLKIKKSRGNYNDN